MPFDYEKYNDNQLRSGGFNPEELTDLQKNLILEPDNAPENYHCDGEITPKQAFASWKVRLKNSGLTNPQINKTIKFVFG